MNLNFESVCFKNERRSVVLAADTQIYWFAFRLFCKQLWGFFQHGLPAFLHVVGLRHHRFVLWWFSQHRTVDTPTRCCLCACLRLAVSFTLLFSLSRPRPYPFQNALNVLLVSSCERRFEPIRSAP